MNIDINKKNGVITDNNFSNGVYANEKRMEQSENFPKKPNDINGLSKDSNKCEATLYSSNDKIKLVNNNGRYYNRIDHFKHKHVFKEDIGLLQAKHNALLLYASEIQRKNDSLENTLRVSIDNRNDMQRLKEENAYLKNELEKISHFFKDNKRLDSLLSSYVEEISSMKKDIDELKKKCNQDIQKMYNIVNTNKENVNQVIEKVKQFFSDNNDNFDQKKVNGKYLIEQIECVLKDNDKIMNESIILREEIHSLMIENESLKEQNSKLIKENNIIKEAYKTHPYNKKTFEENYKTIQEISNSLNFPSFYA